MAYSVSIAKAAEDDVRKAFLWYEEQKRSLGITFEKHVTQAVRSIKSNPFKTQIRYGNTTFTF